MTSQQAKEILLLYRPDIDQDDPDFAEALEQARQDRDLKAWLDQHCLLQRGVLGAFERMAVPEGLQQQIISERKAHVTSTTRRKAAILAFAAIPILLLTVFLAVYSRQPTVADFTAFRLRMVGIVLRDYPQMDLETADLKQIKQYVAQHGGATNYILPAGLEKTRGTGCALLQWRGKKISMLCFNSGKKSDPKNPDLFLFVVDRSSVPQPKQSPEVAAIKGLATASWTAGDKTYLLAGTGDNEFLRQYY